MTSLFSLIVILWTGEARLTKRWTNLWPDGEQLLWPDDDQFCDRTVNNYVTVRRTKRWPNAKKTDVTEGWPNDDHKVDHKHQRFSIQKVVFVEHSLEGHSQ